MVKKRKKKNSNKKILVISVSVCALALAAFFLIRYYTRPHFIHYSEFGIDLPANYDVHGIDVSKHQSIISWEDVAQMRVNNVDIDFAFMKATEGVDNVDGQFKRNWKQAQKQHIARGAYHFFIATKSGKAQALNFMQSVDLEPGDLPPVLDVEQTYGAATPDLQQRVKDFLIIMERKYKVRPIIYTNVDFYKNYLAGKFDDYPLWVAHYLVKDKPRIKREWNFWQHSELGHVNGINAFVDFNVFNGDSAAFAAMRIK